ncbi:expressed unknown protein [Seminavis robusta]|uniref:Uncharacterized protein n=1 Tax=Seminavis robusta TaxID=568900 RepID=A0A9N8HEI7_9STRA|nr:expressed unknown protein [Seminavis robusta]|eukprot:Sro517_g158670.1 n/a (383) ;mRNA; f:31570-32718
MSHLNHHSSNNNNNYNASSSSGMVVQYGFRDDDDDSEDGRPSLFGGLRQSSSRRLKKIGNVVSDAKSLLAGAKAASAGHFGLVYGLDNKYSDSDSESEESESDSDDNASVCSKASVASKAGKTLKILGGKVKKGVKKVRGKRRGSDKVKEYEPEQAPPPPPMGHIHTNSDHEDDEDDDLSDDDDGDASVASRASDAVRRVKGKLSKALKVVNRKNKKYNNEFDDDDSSLSSEEEDLLFDAVPTVPTSRRSLGLRRCHTSSSHEKRSAGPLDVHPTKQAPRRHTSDPMGLQVLRRKSKQPLQDDSDSLSDLSDHNDDARRRGGKKKSSTSKNKNNTTASSSSFHNTNWSMNVTPEMKKKWEMNVSRNLLVVEADHGHGATRAA